MPGVRHESAQLQSKHNRYIRSHPCVPGVTQVNFPLLIKQESLHTDYLMSWYVEPIELRLLTFFEILILINFWQRVKYRTNTTLINMWSMHGPL